MNWRVASRAKSYAGENKQINKTKKTWNNENMSKRCDIAGFRRPLREEAIGTGRGRLK